MLIIDVTGHALNIYNGAANQTQCMFQMTSTSDLNVTFLYPSLDMHWAVLVVPSLFLQTGPLLVIATVLEFISAQSPQSMKGLLVGVFFAIRGLFQFLNSIAIIPLSLKRPWASGEMLENPPVTNCGFVYLLFTCVAGLIGLVLFLAAARRYKYRERNEGLFCQQDVEEIYDRYITQAAADVDQYSDDYSD
jgi:dipeptide/tripeptide permease